MKNLKQYLEEKANTDLSSGIRLIESALSALYKLTIKNNISFDRQFEYVTQSLMKASGYFGLQQYQGNPVQGSITENTKLAIESLSKILSEYNEGLDDPLGWGKICMDIISTLTEAKKE